MRPMYRMDNVPGSQRKEPVIAPFVEQLKTITLRKSN